MLSGLSLARYKITADILMTFAGGFFAEEIEDRVAIMFVVQMKSVLYPPDVKAINRIRSISRFFLAVAYKHCIAIKHFRFGDRLRRVQTFFFFIYFSTGV